MHSSPTMLHKLMEIAIVICWGCSTHVVLAPDDEVMDSEHTWKSRKGFFDLPLEFFWGKVNLEERNMVNLWNVLNLRKGNKNLKRNEMQSTCAESTHKGAN